MYEIYAKLRDMRGLTDCQVAKDVGLGRSTLTDMKKGKHKPGLETIQKLADYFGVSVEYLTTGKDAEKTSADGTSYYFTDYTACIAQEISDNRNLLLLIEIARNSSPENLKFAAELLQRLNHSEENV